MKKMRWLVILVSLLMVGTGVAAETVAGLPLHVQKLNPATVRVWVGDFISSTATVAIATEKGIVVVDTVGFPKVDAELRAVIARELGRNDFKILINTHEHGDHTGGNSVYADCTIVANELAAAGMTRRPEARQRVLDWYTARAPELKREIEKEPAGSPAAKKLQEEMILNGLSLQVLNSDAKPTLPTTTFADRMTMKMGDTTFELYYIGGMHTASDIAILVPEMGLLMTGDTMADAWLNDTPGCLAAFVAREGVRHDFPLLLENWELILQKKSQIKQILTGHWNGELSLKGFEDRVHYIRTLYEGIQKGVKEGKTLDDLQAAYRLETRFPDLAKSPGFNTGNTYMTILEMYIAVAKLESAAARLYALIDEGASDEAVRQVLAARDAKPPKYFFLEGQINMNGYRFFQADKVPQAIRMFRANVTLYPDSWNAYDSLGEALLKAGDNAAAQKMYEKSVSLKPDSKTGLEALEKIRGAATAK
jgi:glyoxylase-like metal-dependent hydrolase (beta-lactamase superfamily II)